MEITIEPLTPDLADDYIHFFDTTPHNFGERVCYCVTWRSDDAYVGDGDHWFPTREERRERARDFVKGGSLRGYLAYHGGDVVGWCNANADCHRCIAYLRGVYPIEEAKPGIRVKSVFCFVIAPEWQRKGIATRMLERVCRDAADEGFDFVEAYANEAFTERDHEFRGPLGMYEKCGFRACGERDGKVVVRKALRG